MITDGKVLRERAILVGMRTPGQPRWEVEDYLDELALLADTAGAVVVGRVLQERSRIDPAYLIGKGKVYSIASMAKEVGANLIIFDDDLTPAQVRNLESVIKAKIVDRTGLILDIFAKRAKTKEAKTQVELAQLRYLLPRLTRRWTHLSRQVGGIGTRGPGETQLEVDRRLIRKRITLLSKELEKIERQRDTRRKGRRDIFKVALVGYTNAGKSTLLNALASTDVAVDDKLFVTLDSTVRLVKLSKHSKILLIDTVGFIRKLPHHLIASFKSTLEEAVSADLLLHVIDISHPNFREQIDSVRQVLRELKIDDKPTIYVFNKVDKVEQQALFSRVRGEYSPCVLISALKGMFLEELKKEIKRLMEKDTIELQVSVDLTRTRIISFICEFTEVLEKDYVDNQAVIRFKANKAVAERILRLVKKEGEAEVVC